MITIVSGVPRSGTSLMMQMLVAGGMCALTDQVRLPDEDNPRGYYEWEPIKRLSQDPKLILAAEGKVVKVISELLTFLPLGPEYRVVFMERPLDEVLQSQETLLRHQGYADESAIEGLADAFQEHFRQLRDHLAMREDIAVSRVGYRRLLESPSAHVSAIRDFLEIPLDVVSMERQVDWQLYRNRS